MIAIDTANALKIPKAIPALKKAGVTHVILYMGIGGTQIPEKRATKAVCDALRAAGIGIISCVESTAAWMLGGATAGRQAATACIVDSAKFGGPTIPFMWAAHDTDITSASDIAKVVACVGGMRERTGPGNAGIYGSARVCQAVHAAFPDVPMWQSCSTGWAGFLPQMQAKAAGFAMFQQMGSPLGNLGVDYDANVCFTDNLGQWGSTVLPAPEPPKEVPVSNPTVEQFIAKAEADFGIHEHNADNKTAINDWFAPNHSMDGEPYCAMGMSKWLITSGFKIAKSSGADELLAQLHDHDKFPELDRSKAQRGDICTRAGGSHIFGILRRIDANYVKTFEANTVNNRVESLTRPISHIARLVRPPFSKGAEVPATTQPQALLGVELGVMNEMATMIADAKKRDNAFFAGAVPAGNATAHDVQRLATVLVQYCVNPEFKTAVDKLV